MSCRGVAAASCPSARRPVCVCNCGGRCHGLGQGIPRDQVRSVPLELARLSDVIRVLAEHGVVLIPQYRPRRRSASRGIPRKRLRGVLGGIVSNQSTFIPEDAEVVREATRLLEWLDLEMLSAPPAPITGRLVEEIGEILEAMDEEDDHDQG